MTKTQLTETRIKSGLNKSKFAKKCSVTLAMLRLYERGDYQIPEKVVERLKLEGLIND